MSQPASNNKEPSKLNKLLNGNQDQSIKARLPRPTGAPAPSNTPPPVAAPTTSAPMWSRYKFGPAFWTIASVISLTMNVGLLIVLLIALQVLGGTKATFALVQNQATGLLGGLYTNFVKMDQATISSSIPVDASIPLNIVVPVQATTRITIAEQVIIPNAHVRINTGALNIDANAEVTLPANTPLVVNLDFPLTVQNSIPIHLDVPVNIPLNHTELHEPFVGLQKVVEPYYCFLQPNTVMNGINVCSPTLSLPVPAETVIP
jgi:hypothetical protein